ncbi:hypothetical protein [Parachryseolinea silvisoli]|jgi:hypothetical protein|uniref:hypothetical protein n=1 Tax=Parachryseolinea silvisoli TaxID=2873601 RepID=UPI002265A443|nr:hypothetical protein [Parachryseolinea silvisoli]MCD9016937.1 hypothetical protein [Parachryseolinea silvisoli]
MKQFLKFGLIFTMATSGLLLTACGDGDPGISGAQGEKGDTGDMGSDGEGFDELTQYGNIVVRYKGARIDNVAFDKTFDFKFSPNGPDLAWTSSVSSYEYGEGQSALAFELSRYHSAMMSGSSTSYVRFSFDKPADGSESTVNIESQVAIISDDKKSFSTYPRFELPFSQAVSEYSFNAATGELMFEFKCTVPADNKYNDTNNDLEISAEVNVKVVQDIDTPK